MIDQIPIISPLLFWRKDTLDNVSREISEFVDQIIVDHRHNWSISLFSSEDILDLLLSAVDTQGQPFNDQKIKDQALTVVLAHHETTGNVMTSTMYVLMTNEQVLQACRDDVDRVVPNGIEPT
jgi:cytochrome P450